MNHKHTDLNRVHHINWSHGKTVLLLMTIPSFLFVLVFSYVPIFGWAYAFFDYSIGMKLSQCDFRGLYFIKLALSDTYLLGVLKNTLALSFLGLLNLPLACIFAIFLSQMKGRIYKKFIQSAATLPFFISWVIVFSMAYSLFAIDNGLVNKVLLDLNVISSPIDPIANGGFAWIFQTSLALWKGVGYNAIIFFAAIAGIDTQLYDAADVDGAGRFKKMWHVTIPGIIPTFITLMLIGIGFMLSNGFDQYYVFMNPMVQEKIEVLDYYVYKVGLMQNDVTVGTALSMTKTIVSVLLLFSVNFLSKKARGQSIL
ncbi:MAG TPA: ABC transporter permease subunit [Ruminiclostridium sp.]